jgi:hypothetical protein
MMKLLRNQLINARSLTEIREHMMSYKLKDRVREAYFLADPDELRKIYLRYEHLSVKGSAGMYFSDEFENYKDRTISYVT